MRLRTALENAIKSDSLMSPRKVAISVGYSSPDRVLKKFPDLCAALTLRIRDRVTKRRRDIRMTLENALQQSPTPTLEEIAMTLKMSSSSALRIHEPLLCDKVLTLREDWQRRNHEGVKVILERALEQNDIPPFRRFCKVAEISIDLVISRFPEQKKAFDEKYRILRVAERLRRTERFQREVERIVRLLKERDEYPSAGRVVTENPGLRSGGWDQLQRAIHMAQNAI
jgi:hypothetical protein